MMRLLWAIILCGQIYFPLTYADPLADAEQKIQSAIHSEKLGTSAAGVTSTDIRDEIYQALARVGRLHSMDNSKTYSLPARGTVVSGIPDDFLRRREPQEILDSGFSSGCGDWAAAFYGLMREKGATLLFIDAIELSVGSLLNRDNGHTGVAVKNPYTGKWILTDPTSGVIVSEDWNPAAKMYIGPVGRFWIWYAGPLEQYPAHNHEELKKFYDQALRAVSADVWDKEVIRLDFDTDPSFQNSDGSYFNPHYPAFKARFSKIYDELNLHPQRQIKVIFAKHTEDIRKDCERTGINSWACFVRPDSVCGEGWFTWIEEHIARELNQSANQESK